jgi:hypothetical protein
MISRRSAEEWVAAVNEIVRLYRGSAGNSDTDTISREEAVARLRELGVSEGEAARWLN